MEGENVSPRAEVRQSEEEFAATPNRKEVDGGAGSNGMANGTSHVMSNGLEAVNGVHIGRSDPASSPPAMQSSQVEYETNFESVEEERLLKLMRANVTKLNPETKSVDDSTLRRFLRARQRKVDKATDMFMEHFEWRRTYVPLGYIPESEIPNELGAKKVFLQGRDKCGRPIGVIQASKHDAKKRNLEEFKKYCVYNFDKCVASMNPGEEKFTVIVDLHSLGYKNLDPRGWTVVFDFLQAHYPERIHKIFLIHVPYIFWGAWKIVNKFIDKRTREKIMFVEDKHLEELLSKDISKDQLPTCCGGELDLVLIQDALTPNWPPKKTTAVLDL